MQTSAAGKCPVKSHWLVCWNCSPMRVVQLDFH